MIPDNTMLERIKPLIGEIHQYFCKQLDNLPSHYADDGDLVYDSTKDVDAILSHNKNVCNLIESWAKKEDNP